MTDKIDPRLGVLTELLDLQYDEGYNGQEGVLDADVLAAIDAADRAAGIVRVDTNDEALVEKIAAAIWWEAWGDLGAAPTFAGLSDDERALPLRQARAVLAALREES